VRVGEILVVELLGGIGDTLLALPAVHALARAHPRAAVRVLTFRPGEELLAADPCVAEAVGVAKGPGAARAAVARQLADRRPDLAVTTTTYDGIPALLAASSRRAVADLWRSPPPDERVDRRFLRLLAADGLVDPADVDLPLRVHLDPGELAAARSVLTEPVPLVLLPGAGMPVKRWPPERWEALATSYAGPVVTVAGEPVPGARELPPLGLRELAAVLAVAAERGGAAVGADTGPVRLAAAVRCPAVALYGPTLAARYGLTGPHTRSPQGLPDCDVRVPADFTRQQCWWSARCPYTGGAAACMADIGVAAVLDAVEAARSSRGRSPAAATVPACDAASPPLC